MYIYQVHGVYPQEDFCRQLKANLNAVGVHRPIALYDYSPYVDKYKEQNIVTTLPIPYFLHQKKLDVAFGQMDTADIINDSRKIFTVWQHPLIHTYALYDWIKLQTELCPPKERADYSCIGDYDVQEFEKYIDNFISTKGRLVFSTGKYKGKWLYEGYTRISKLHPNMYHIGCVEQIDLFIDFIENTFDFEIDTSDPKWDNDKYLSKASPHIFSEYRKDDLTHLLKDDINLWETHYQ